MTSMSGPIAKRRGFTLIELLVVIAIIAILAAILFPVFATARDKARQTACLSNTKQLGTAVLEYQQDYDECSPDSPNPWQQGNGWACMVYPYVKSKAVFICPSDSSGVSVACSYGYNANNVHWPGGICPGACASGAPSTGYQLSQYSAPGMTVLFFEVANCGAIGAGGNFDVSIPPYTVQGSAPYPDAHCSGPGTGCDGYSPAGRGLGNLEWELNGFNASSTTNVLQYATGYMLNSSTVPLTYGGSACCGNQLGFTGATGRHLGGSCFLMEDGHAKWLMPTRVSAGWSNTSAGSCGGGAAAANTSCTTVSATFSIN